jgi:nucleoside-triphosphatase THEP1
MRTAIQAEDLRSGSTQQLAERSEQPTPGSKQWKFDRATMEWCNQVFKASTPTDLLVVDELGPLEFEQDSGFQDGMAAIDTKNYAIALVVVRAEMLGEAMLRWPDANLVEIDTPEDSQHKAEVIAGQLF